MLQIPILSEVKQPLTGAIVGSLASTSGSVSRCSAVRLCGRGAGGRLAAADWLRLAGRRALIGQQFLAARSD